MAKNAGRLAGLAALGAAAYMMSKGKDKDKEAGTTDSNPTRAARPEPTETRLKSPAQSIAEADKSDKSGPSVVSKQPSGTLIQGPDKSSVDLNEDRNKPPEPPKAVQPAPNANVSSTPPAPIVRSMQNDTKQNVLNALNNQAGANTPSAQRTDQLANLSRAVKREDQTKKEAQKDFPGITRTWKNPEKQKVYDKVNSQAGATESSAFKTDALGVASRAAKAADARRRAAAASSYKKGGMTSTASSASKRADGIASRGKTKCKMY